MPKIILATESRYKRRLFDRLHISYHSIAPHIDETPHPNEDPQALALRLSHEKAMAAQKNHPLDWCIGADQTAGFQGGIVSKPITHSQATLDLATFSGHRVTFHTAACVVGPNGESAQMTETTRVRFRRLTAQEIDTYLHLDTPYDCAGAFKAESLGITLFDSIETNDPTALIGLPLIKLSACLRAYGFHAGSSSLR